MSRMIRHLVIKCNEKIKQIRHQGNGYSPLKNSTNDDWSLLPDPIFDKIILIIGLESPESLHNCKQVCKAWKKGIMRNLWDSPSKKLGSVIERRIENSSWGPKNFPSDKKLSHVKLLGNNGDKPI